MRHEINLFDPGLRKPKVLLPARHVLIAWADLAKLLSIFAVMLIAAVAVMVRMLLRMRIFQAIKLDEVG